MYIKSYQWGFVTFLSEHTQFVGKAEGGLE